MHAEGRVGGALDVMVGGEPAAVERARPVLEAFAQRVVPTYAALYAEALMLGAKVGLTPEVFDSVIRGGRMDCGFYHTSRPIRSPVWPKCAW
jgi:3-hydroxyisobutyrate dehydrogenase-like beta-hydroxyacid dehydrogenase